MPSCFASPGEAMGEATFLAEPLPGVPAPVRVRAVTLIDVKSERINLRGIEAKQFDALVALRRALQSEDSLALQGATARMEEVYQMREQEVERHRHSTGDEEARSFWSETIQSLRPGSRTKENPARLFSLEVSRTVGLLNAQIVLWWWSSDSSRRFSALI